MLFATKKMLFVIKECHFATIDELLVSLVTKK
jgi:hypothetical protein